MASLMTAPVLSTPDTLVFEQEVDPQKHSVFSDLTDGDLEQIYEIERTVSEIGTGGWHSIALQFPDDMLKDAPRVFGVLRDRLTKNSSSSTTAANGDNETDTMTEATASLSVGSGIGSTASKPVKLTILADTSYGACCVDEIAAEHVDAQVVVHYGRTCLSPTARLPIIYVFTLMPLNRSAVVEAIRTAHLDIAAKLMLLADVPYQGHVETIAGMLETVGYSNLYAPSVIHDPSSLIPNRTIPHDVQTQPALLQDYAIIHISDPPPALLLTLGSRVKSVHVIPDSVGDSSSDGAFQASATQSLRRRYALIAKLSTVPIFGILINTLSVKNYLDVLQHVKDLITKAGKKYYTFVVGKVNAAKVANFSEVGGWVVIGCWESSLIESKDFWKPIITPFELKLALTDETERIWTGEWTSDFQKFLNEERQKSIEGSGTAAGGDMQDGLEAHESEDESEPPVFDLRTGRYVSQSRPMARRPAQEDKSKPSTSLIKKAGQELARIGGEVSPAAEFLRSNRTWRGLGTDINIEYQYDNDGKLQGAQMEQGRSGIAKGYQVGEDASKS